MMSKALLREILGEMMRMAMDHADRSEPDAHAVLKCIRLITTEGTSTYEKEMDARLEAAQKAVVRADYEAAYGEISSAYTFFLPLTE